MKLVAETIAALGAPAFMRTVGEESSPSAVIARWRHRGAEIDVGASDTVRVPMSLQTGQHVCLRTGDGVGRLNIKVGSVSVMPACERTKVAIRGQADILSLSARLLSTLRLSGYPDPRAVASLAIVLRESDLRILESYR